MIRPAFASPKLESGPVLKHGERPGLYLTGPDCVELQLSLEAVLRETPHGLSYDEKIHRANLRRLADLIRREVAGVSDAGIAPEGNP